MTRHLLSERGPILAQFVRRRAAVGLLLVGSLAPTSCQAAADVIPLLRSTDGFVASSGDPRVLYEPGAEASAQAVVTALPAAITRVEAAEYGPFAVPIRIYVCATIACYRRFTGEELSGGHTTIRKRIFISPKTQNTPARLPFVVAHELAHLHLAQQLNLLRAAQLPIWFNEGFATLASQGGGAEDVSDADAARAIVAGLRFTPAANRGYSGSHFGLSAHLFYRQAALFIAFLRDENGDAFRAFMLDLQGGAAFGRAFQDHFGTELSSKWSAFVDGLTAQATRRTISGPLPTRNVSPTLRL